MKTVQLGLRRRKYGLTRPILPISTLRNNQRMKESISNPRSPHQANQEIFFHNQRRNEVSTATKNENSMKDPRCLRTARATYSRGKRWFYEEQ